MNKEMFVLELPRLTVTVGKEFSRDMYPEGDGVYFVSQENGNIYVAEVCNENGAVAVTWLPQSVLKQMWKKEFQEEQQHIVEVLMDKLYDRLEEMTDKISIELQKNLAISTQRIVNLIPSFTEADEECLHKIAAGVDAIHKEMESLSKVSGVSESTLLDIIRTVSK